MSPSEASALPAAALRDAVTDGRTTAVDAVRASQARAAEVNAGPSGLNAILWTDDAAAVREAEAVDARRGESDGDMPLAGVPVVVKDNIATHALPTTCGSRILEGYVSPFEATAVRRLRDAGAIVIAKSNMDEFGMGSSTEHSAYGPPRHPMDRTLVPGGSSGGSAVAVATGVVRIALGSETGGSVRQPVSEPSAMRTAPVATAAAEPPDEPPGTRAGSIGLRVGP